jgi:hypothetical protein|tara:strand:+ start:272 stop:721 length:450 start_codon:yes stop_codon:yes gene_type:complete
MSDNINMNIEEEVFDKKPRVLTDKQKSSLAAGRAKAKAIRDAKKNELKEVEEDIKVSHDLKKTGRKLKTKQLVRQTAIEKRVKRNAYERKFDDVVDKISSEFDDENDLKKFNGYISKISSDDFHSESELKASILKILKFAGDEHRASKK